MVRGEHFPPQNMRLLAGVAQWIEQQPSKLLVAGSSPVTRTMISKSLIYMGLA